MVFIIKNCINNIIKYYLSILFKYIYIYIPSEPFRKNIESFPNINEIKIYPQ